MKIRTVLLIFPITLIMSSLACNLPSTINSTPQAAATLDQLYTAAALTEQAGTATPPETATNPFPTYPVSTSAASTPAPVLLCNAAAFVKDVTFSDGSAVGRGQDFTKIWRIQNIGTCSWSPSYALVFVSGNQLGAAPSLAIPVYVNPGQTIDLAVDMVAPDKNGRYQGFWMLRDASGALFGIGGGAESAFWVDINVTGPIYTAYDFAANYCAATWDNQQTTLPCPGSKGDNDGFVIHLDHPVMESGKTEDKAGLLTVPRDVNNGLIRGKFPAFKIHDGDRFQALVNCQYQAYSCNVVFRLDYQIDGGDIRTLGQWVEAYEGKYYPVDVDLSSLSGENVKFMLIVTSNGSQNQDNALWVAPRIIRMGNAPTATPTFTVTNTPTFTPTATFTETPMETATVTP